MATSQWVEQLPSGGPEVRAAYLADEFGDVTNDPALAAWMYVRMPDDSTGVVPFQPGFTRMVTVGGTLVITYLADAPDASRGARLAWLHLRMA